MSSNSDRRTLSQPTFDHGINHVTASQDDRFVAMSDVDMNVRVESNGDWVFNQNFHSQNEKIRPMDRVRGLNFSADSSLLYIASGDRVTAFSTDTWEQRWQFVAPRSFGFLIISPIALDTCGTGEFVTAFDNGSMTLWTQEGSRKRQIRDNDSPRWLKFSADGHFILGTDSFSVCRWNLVGGEPKEKISLADRAFGFASDSQCRHFAIRTLSEISIWNFEDRKPMARLSVGASIPLLAFHPTKPLLICGEQNMLRVVDFDGRIVNEERLDVASALSIGFANRGSKMLVGCTDLHLIERDFSIR